MFRTQPVAEELQNGEGFGYIIAFRPLGTVTWTRAAVSAPGVSRYAFRNDTIPPFVPFDVKVGAYNHRGEGPFSAVATVYSAEEGTAAPVMELALIAVFHRSNLGRRLSPPSPRLLSPSLLPHPARNVDIIYELSRRWITGNANGR